jgi:hypothetical protein
MNRAKIKKHKFEIEKEGKKEKKKKKERTFHTCPQYVCSYLI